MATPSCPWVCRIRFCSRVSLCHTINELTSHFLCILSKRRRELVKPGGTQAVFEAGRMPWVGIEDQKGSIAPSSGARGLCGGTVGVQEAPCAGTGAFGCSSREGFWCGSLVPSSSSPQRRECRWGQREVWLWQVWFWVILSLFSFPLRHKHCIELCVCPELNCPCS